MSLIPTLMISPGDNEAMGCSWRAIRDITNYSQAMEKYKLDNYHYPTTEQGLRALFSTPEDIPRTTDWNGPYLSLFVKDPWGRDYFYRAEVDSFEISSLGADGEEGGHGCDADLSSQLTY